MISIHYFSGREILHYLDVPTEKEAEIQIRWFSRRGMSAFATKDGKFFPVKGAKRDPRR